MPRVISDLETISLRRGRWEEEEAAGLEASVESSPDDSPWELVAALAGPGSEGGAAFPPATRAPDSAARFGGGREGEEGRTLPAARADGTAAVDGRTAPSATVFRRPLNGEDAADGAHLRWADPVNESRDGGGRGPPATPQDAVTVRDADLSQEVDRRAGRRDGRAVLEGGLLDGDEGCPWSK